MGVFERQHGKAPQFTLPNLRAGAPPVRLSALRGHPVIVNFWASWCPPCRKEMPALQAVARRYAGRIDFVGIDTNDQLASATSFLARTGVRYQIAFDPSASTAAAYGVFGMPTTFFVAPNGTLLGREVGGLTAAKLLALIRKLYPSLS